MTIADDVIAQHRLLTERFGIDRCTRPRLVGRRAADLRVGGPLSGHGPADGLHRGRAKPSPWTRLWLRTVTEEPLTADPAWRDGFYTDAADLQAAARRVGHAAALTLTPDAFYREGQEMWRPLGFASAEDFVVRFWENFWLAQDPGDVVAQARKARAADPAAGGDLAEALGDHRHGGGDRVHR